jgi:ELWxxDGT repeat protein
MANRRVFGFLAGWNAVPGGSRIPATGASQVPGAPDIVAAATELHHPGSTRRGGMARMYLRSRWPRITADVAWLALVAIAVALAVTRGIEAQEPAILVRDINSAPSEEGSFPFELIEVGGQVIFRAGQPCGYGLWRSDGSELGTQPIAVLQNALDAWLPYQLTAVGSTVFFAAADDTHGAELWASDGSAAGTALVKDIWPGPEGAQPLELLGRDALGEPEGEGDLGVEVGDDLHLGGLLGEEHLARRIARRESAPIKSDINRSPGLHLVEGKIGPRARFQSTVAAATY